jgi:hypothetical protein
VMSEIITKHNEYSALLNKQTQNFMPWKSPLETVEAVEFTVRALASSPGRANIYLKRTDFQVFIKILESKLVWVEL